MRISLTVAILAATMTVALPNTAMGSLLKEWIPDDRGVRYFNHSSSHNAQLENAGNIWIYEDRSWYYLDADNYRIENMWLDNCYMGPDGRMLTNTTTPDGYQVGDDGTWTSNDLGNSLMEEDFAIKPEFSELLKMSPEQLMAHLGEGNYSMFPTLAMTWTSNDFDISSKNNSYSFIFPNRKDGVIGNEMIAMYSNVRDLFYGLKDRDKGYTYTELLTLVKASGATNIKASNYVYHTDPSRELSIGGSTPQSREVHVTEIKFDHGQLSFSITGSYGRFKPDVNFRIVLK